MGTGDAVGGARRDGRKSGFGIGWVISDLVSKSGYKFFAAIRQAHSTFVLDVVVVVAEGSFSQDCQLLWLALSVFY